ncbi:MAG: hypothetical protein LBB98_11300 [Treponema sp.]|nr:hypothetical protein [Treponema sp.]
MNEKRNSIRYLSCAEIRIDENQNTRMFLRDISLTGCSITNSPSGFEADAIGDAIAGIYPEADREYNIIIFPEAESGIMSFTLKVELCWSCIQGKLYAAGGIISGYPEGSQYQLFANYLAWQAANI